MERKTFVVGLVLLAVMVVLSGGFKSGDTFLMITARLLGSAVLCWLVYHGIRYKGSSESKNNPKRAANLALVTSGLILIGITFVFGTVANLAVYAIWIAFLYWNEMHMLVLKEKEKNRLA